MNGSALLAMFERAWDLLSSTGMEKQHGNTPSIPGPLHNRMQHLGRLCSFQWCIPSVVRGLGPCRSAQDVLTDLVILNGNSTALEASTCYESMVTQWGKSGTKAFELICKTVTRILETGDSCIVTDKAELHLEDISGSRKIAASWSSVALTIGPALDFHYEFAIVQAIRWMCAAIRDDVSLNEGTESSGNGLCLSGVFEMSLEHPDLQVRTKPTMVSLFRLEPLSPRGTDNDSSCWEHLFHKVPVAHKMIGRPWGRGLQLPFDLLVELAAAETYVAFNGGTVLLGYFTALIPIEVDTGGKCIQWHLESLDEAAGEVMSLQKLRELVKYDWLKTRPENIHGKTCFLGWASNANILLGTQKLVERKKPMTWTQGLKLRTRGIESDGFEVGGQLSIPITGISPVLKASKSYKFVRYTTRRHPLGDYRSALDCLQRKVSLLIDSESKQAWLVPMLSLVLHLCHVYFQASNTSNQRNPIPFAQPSPNGYQAAKIAIADCGSLTVFGSETDEDRLLFRTLLFRILLNLNDHPRNTVSKWRRGTRT